MWDAMLIWRSITAKSGPGYVSRYRDREMLTRMSILLFWLVFNGNDSSVKSLATARIHRKKSDSIQFYWVHNAAFARKFELIENLNKVRICVNQACVQYWLEDFSRRRYINERWQPVLGFNIPHGERDLPLVHNGILRDATSDCVHEGWNTMTE